MMQSSKILKNLRKRTIKNFMDIFILGQLKENPLSGYDIIGLVHKRFDVLMSSGTIYALLYSMERDGLIKGIHEQRKRVYELTEKGEKAIQVLGQANGEIQNCLKNMLTSS
jgi:DNA-binding PadR family transcriptional regulator